MTRMERTRYEMLLRVRDFGRRYQSRFPESSDGAQAFATVARAVAEIEASPQEWQGLLADLSGGMYVDLQRSLMPA